MRFSDFLAFIFSGMLCAQLAIAQAQDTLDTTVSTDGRATGAPIHSKFVRDMLGNGIEIQGTRIRLPEPTFVEESLAVEVERYPDVAERLADLAGNIGWSRFSRDNLNAPVRIKIDALTATDSAAGIMGLSVHQTYIAYAPLSLLREQALMELNFGAGKENSEEGVVLRRLSSEELESRGIQPTQSGEAYYWLELPLLRKVMIRGVLQTQAFEGQTGIVVYWRLDPRFTPDASAETAGDISAAKAVAAAKGLNNVWSPLATNDLGVQVEGQKHAYDGMAGFMAAMETGLEDRQLLIESRMLIEEPEAWFGGTKYLRSKLSLALQEGAKRMRRTLRQ